jgi:hypothetical protein
MTLPNGYSDVPAGKIATVVTHLEMTERPALRPDPPGPWTLRRVETPGLDWYRDLHRRVGEEWLWFARLQLADAELAASSSRRWWGSMRWSRTAVTKACWSWIFVRPVNANWGISASPQN